MSAVKRPEPSTTAVLPEPASVPLYRTETVLPGVHPLPLTVIAVPRGPDDGSIAMDAAAGCALVGPPAGVVRPAVAETVAVGDAEWRGFADVDPGCGTVPTGNDGLTDGGCGEASATAC